MNVKKFLAATSREAFRLVREALGADAVILSNRKLGDNVEILALANEDMSALVEPAMNADPDRQRPPAAVTERAQSAAQARARLGMPVPVPYPTPAPASDSVQAMRWPQSLPERPPKGAVSAAAGSRAGDGDQADGLADALQLAQSAQATHAAAPEPQMKEVVDEIRSMRGMIESQLAELSWTGQQQREPVRGAILGELLAAGFSASLARFLAGKMPPGLTQERAIAWVRAILARNLKLIDNENDMLGQGGVFALVGPTGVGKTTTTAKLAARCVMRHGSGKLALITTDGYRIGAYEQLRIYGKILSVMVHSVKDDADLRIALEELKHKHTVLIDTVGVSQRDHMVAEQIAMLAGAGVPVKRLLCVSATSSGETLAEVARAYKGNGLAGCIITKLDEAATIGSALDLAIRQKLTLFYVANGQRVPEDLQVADRDTLIERAFAARLDTASFSLRDDELPLVAANVARGARDNSLREVILG
jgi:flagellar biosynthesis protein FlhF